MGKSAANLHRDRYNRRRGRDDSLMGISPTTTRCLICAAILWLGAAGGARASIEVPECQLFSGDFKLDTCVSSEAGSAGGSSSPRQSSDENQNKRGFDLATEQVALSFGGSSTGTSTSSSSSGGSSNTFAVRSASADLVTDPAIAGWLSGERRFAIPMPPVNSLLRPPQG